MTRTALLLTIGTVWLLPTHASAASAQALQACVQKKLAQLPACIRLHGKADTDPCRTGIFMELTDCTDKFDAEKLHTKDPVRRKILFDACVKLHNPGTGQTAKQECDLSFPPVGK